MHSVAFHPGFHCLSKDTWSGFWPEVINLFSCSTRLRMKLIMLINVKMPTRVDILTFMSMIITRFESLKARKARNVFIFELFSLHEQLKFHAQFS